MSDITKQVEKVMEQLFHILKIQREIEYLKDKKLLSINENERKLYEKRTQRSYFAITCLFTLPATLSVVDVVYDNFIDLNSCIGKPNLKLIVLVISAILFLVYGLPKNKT